MALDPILPSQMRSPSPGPRVPRAALALAAALLLGAPPLRGQIYRPGALHYLTGCVNGRLRFPRVDLFDRPPEARPGPDRPDFVARLSGTSRQQICDGDVVIVRDSRRVGGRVFVEVEPVRLDVVGWIESPFLGASFPRYLCERRFEDRAHVRTCLTGRRPPEPPDS